MEPATAASRPLRCTSTGIRVWNGRFPGAISFA